MRLEAFPDGGVATRRELSLLGIDDRQIATLKRAGILQQVRRGWYRTAQADEAVVAAVRAGGTLACVSALARLPEVWTPRDGRAHVRLRRPDGRRTCSAFRALPSPRSAVDPLPAALLCAADCVPPDQFAAVLDSTLRMPSPLTVQDLRELFDGAPNRLHQVLDRLDPLSGSGAESLVRYRLRAANIAVRSQVRIHGVGRVDLLVGERLIIECDSRGFHNTQRLNDIRRDRVATVGDYRILRVDYTDVLCDWDSVYRQILVLVRKRRHRGATAV